MWPPKERAHESPRRLHVVILHLIDQRLERITGHVLNHTSAASLGSTSWQCHQAAMVAVRPKTDRASFDARSNIAFQQQLYK
ncbi:unnamed protein product [Timema podura]|uniref:Uncharacterized protein n=1 Tax=Timema podura TaxID=61482 RepID=A0ABN7NQ33_TIMPD|nr:unnamed protein product [Timema podura]